MGGSTGAPETPKSMIWTLEIGFSTWISFSCWLLGTRLVQRKARTRQEQGPEQGKARTRLEQGKRTRLEDGKPRTRPEQEKERTLQNKIQQSYNKAAKKHLRSMPIPKRGGCAKHRESAARSTLALHAGV